MCQSVYHSWPAGREELQKERKKKITENLVPTGTFAEVSRYFGHPTLLEFHAADNFNDIIRMNFQITWKKNLSGR